MSRDMLLKILEKVKKVRTALNTIDVSGITEEITEIESIIETLNGEIDDLDDAVTPATFTMTAGENVTLAVSSAFKIGKIVVFSLLATLGANFTANEDLVTFGGNTNGRYDFRTVTSAGNAVSFYIANETNRLRRNSGTMNSGDAITLSGVFLIGEEVI